MRSIGEPAGASVPPPFEPHRFATAAAHYLTGRPPYAPRLLRHVAALAGLGAADRVLDLGCGPGQLAAGFTGLAGEVLAVDPEPAMLRIAEQLAGKTGKVKFRQGSSYDLGPDFGRFRLATMGRSFHWMDREETLRRLDRLTEPGGAVALFSDRHADLPENAWREPFRAMVRHFGGENPAKGRFRHTEVLLNSAFSALDAVSVIERRQVTVESLVDRAFSMSSTSPGKLGERAGPMAAALRAVLGTCGVDGFVTEVVAVWALVGRRPHEVEG
jgi:SAM-dependent methyltransferase